MKHLIKEWGIVFIIVAFLGGIVLPAMAAPRDGSCKAANNNDCTRIVWDIATAISNTTGIEKTNGVTQDVFTVFTNSGSADVDVWLQHADKIENDSCSTATFANAITTAITIAPGDTDSFIHQGSIRLLPCVRWNIKDSDITTNNITFITWMW